MQGYHWMGTREMLHETKSHGANDNDSDDHGQLWLLSYRGKCDCPTQGRDTRFHLILSSPSVLRKRQQRTREKGHIQSSKLCNKACIHTRAPRTFRSYATMVPYITRIQLDTIQSTRYKDKKTSRDIGLLDNWHSQTMPW